jgi:hypothetical protein
MLNLAIEKASLSNFSLFRVPSVKVFRLQLDLTIGITVVFLHLYPITHMFKRRLVDPFGNGLCRLKDLFMVFFVAILDFSSHDFLDCGFIRILYSIKVRIRKICGFW